MSNVLISYPNRTESMTLAGGAWTTQLPLSYLLTRQLAQVARSTDAQATNTWFYLTAATAVACGVFAVAGHNLGYTGKWRLRGWTNNPKPVNESVFTGAKLPAGWSCVRAGSAYYFDAAGNLRSAAANVARPAYVGGVCTGILLESSTIPNSLTWCRDGTNAAWSKSSLTAALTATGADGAANSATRLTGGGSTGRISQSTGLGAAQGTLSVLLRRVSGTSPVRLTLDHTFTTTTVVPITSTWAVYTLTGTMSASGVVGIQLDGSSDVIEMDFAMFEAQVSVAGTPIYTTSAVAYRPAESLTYDGAAAVGMLLSAGAMLAKFKIARPPTATAAMMTLTDTAGTSYVGFTLTSGGVPAATLVNSSSEQLSGMSGSAVATGSNVVAALSWAANDARVSFAGGAVSTDSTVTVSSNAVLTMRIQPGSAAIIHIDRLAMYSATKTNAQLQALSGSELEIPADYDTGLLDAWNSAWVAGTTAEQKAGERGTPFHKPATPQTFAYWRVDFSDASNASGYIQAGRVFMGDAFTPSVNMSIGCSIGYLSRDLIVEADSGSEYGVRRPSPRFMEFTLAFLNDSDALGTHLEMQRQLGTLGECFVAFDPADTLQLHRRAWLARLEKLTPLDMPDTTQLWRTSYRAKERL